MDQIKIRRASAGDLVDIVEIYNEAILEGGYTADLEPTSVEARRAWLARIGHQPFGVYVLEARGQVIGYFYFSPWRGGRAALRSIAEISFYLHAGHRGKGLGDFMLKRALELARENGFEHLLAILLDSNHRSRALLKKNGFTRVGHLPDVAQLPGRRAGQYLMLHKVKGS